MIRSLAVVVPAADEEARLPSCLDALDRARRCLRSCRPGIGFVRTVVVLDRCIDGSEAIARSRPWVDVARSDAGLVGAARARGADRVLGGYHGVLSDLWIANTDADSEVPPNWLVTMVDLADSGADLVLGTVMPDDLPHPLLHRWLDRHHLRDGHPHVHAANLGVRADAYIALGGWRPTAHGEDVDLVDRASARDLRIARSGAVPVRTSGRLRGRAPNGFADYLHRLGAGAEDGVAVQVTGGSRAVRQPVARPLARESAPPAA